MALLVGVILSSSNFVHASAAPNDPTLPQGMYLADSIKPSLGGTPNTHLCRAGWVITQIQVAKIAPNPYLPGFRFSCSPISNIGEIGAATDVHEIVNMGVTKDDYANYSCPIGQAMFSISAYTERYVKDVNADCTNPHPFRRAIEASKGIGFGWPTNATSSCNKTTNEPRTATFMTGIYASSAAGVDSLQSICGDFLIHEKVPPPRNIYFDYQNGILKATTDEIPSMELDPIVRATLESDCLKKLGDDKIAGAFLDNKYTFVITSQHLKECLGGEVYVKYYTNFSESIPLQTKIIAPAVEFSDKTLTPITSYENRNIQLKFPTSPEIANKILSIHLVFNNLSKPKILEYQGIVNSEFSVFTIKVEEYLSNLGYPVFLEIRNNASTTASKLFSLGNYVTYSNLDIPKPIISSKSGKTSLSLATKGISSIGIAQTFLVLDGKVIPQVSVRNTKSNSLNFQLPLKPASRSIKPELWILGTNNQITRTRISIKLPG